MRNLFPSGRRRLEASIEKRMGGAARIPDGQLGHLRVGPRLDRPRCGGPDPDPAGPALAPPCRAGTRGPSERAAMAVSLRRCGMARWEDRPRSGAAAGELGDGDRNDAVSAGEVVRAHVRARPVAGEDADDRSRHAGQDLAGHGIQPGGRRACGPPPTLSPRPRSSMSSSCCLDPRGCQSRTARLAPPPPGGCEGWS